MPTPADPRKKPLSVKIHVKTGAGVDIQWADGHSSHFDFPYLRDLCPCASCNDEREKNSLISSAFAHSPAPVSLPMFKPKPRAQAATQVGSYAIQITFNDGHSTGIFSYDYLRSHCPCSACAADFRSTTP